MSKTEQRIMGVLKKQKRTSVSLRELCQKSGAGKTGRNEVIAILRILEDDNKVIEKNGKYALIENLGLVAAEVVKVNETFGFAHIDGENGDIFIPGRMLLGAMPGDLVLIKKKRTGGELPEGEVCKISKMSDRKFSGILKIEDGNYFIIPDRYARFPVKLLKRGCTGLNEGDKILARIARRGERHSEHAAEVVSGFGGANKASACCGAILAENDIYAEFPLDVQEQAKTIGADAVIHSKEIAARTDLRGEMIFTIDGADTKDIDDAVSLETTAKGWRLGVHIADVSYYVPFKSPADSEAFARGTSVYYADSVIPMLPEELSNGICSLNPNEDRLAFSAIIELDKNAKIEGYEFKKTIIRSRIKGVYSEINTILAGNATPAVLTKYEKAQDMLFEMNELAKRLTRNRYNRGGIDFESVESKITVGDDGSPVNVEPRKRGISEMIIEEFMLIANEAAARLAIKENLPFVYRVHEKPAPDKLEQLYETLDKLGVSCKRPKGESGSEQLKAVLEQVKGTELESVVNNMVLRTMAKAAYSSRNFGHFGLALDDYTHFTSPIRRYPDLTIHRILSAHITGMRHDNIDKRFKMFAQEAAAHSTKREIAAMSAERGCEDAYKAEYMIRHIGAEFKGTVSSVTQFGLYVRLENTVEGLVRTQSLPHGHWQFDGSVSFYDALSKNRIRIGDRLRVRVLAADASSGHVDFEFVNTAPEKG